MLWGSCRYETCFSPVNLPYVNVIVRPAKGSRRGKFSAPTAFSVTVVLLQSDCRQLTSFLGTTVLFCFRGEGVAAVVVVVEFLSLNTRYVAPGAM